MTRTVRQIHRVYRHLFGSLKREPESWILARYLIHLLSDDEHDITDHRVIVNKTCVYLLSAWEEWDIVLNLARKLKNRLTK